MAWIYYVLFGQGSKRTGRKVGLGFAGFGLYGFVAEAIAFGVERFSEPLVRLLISVIGASVLGDALHDDSAGFL